MSNGQANSLSAHSPTRGTRADPLCVGYVQDGKVFSLISSLPSSLSANDVPPLFEGFIGVGSEEARLRAGLRPPLKLHVRFSRMQLARRLKPSGLSTPKLHVYIKPGKTRLNHLNLQNLPQEIRGEHAMQSKELSRPS